MRHEGRACQVDFDGLGRRGFHCGREGIAVLEPAGRGGEGRAVGTEVGRRERFDAELGREVACESVELVRVGARHEDAAVGQQIGGGVVHARDGRPGERFEAPARRVVGAVEHGRLHGVYCVAPALRTAAGAVDDEHLARRQQDHVAHEAPLRHGLHGPAGVRRQRRHAAACLRRRLALGVHERAVGGPAADQDLGIVEVSVGGQRQQHGAPGGRVVARFPGDGWVVADDLVGLPVVEARVTVGEDPELVVGQ